jgi:polyhydroxyalkanoate synthesis regulator phasin
MPDRRDNPEAQSETDMLRQEVAALTVTLAALERKLGDVLTVEQAAQRFPSRDEARRSRRRTAVTVLVSVLIAVGVAIGGDNLAIRGCFLGSSGASHESTVCNLLFPGYNASVRVGNERLRKFSDVLASIPANAQTNRDQQAQIDRLRREVADLQRRVGRH